MVILAAAAFAALMFFTVGRGEAANPKLTKAEVDTIIANAIAQADSEP